MNRMNRMFVFSRIGGKRNGRICRPRAAATVFLLMLTAALAASVWNYVRMKECIVGDVNQALAETLRTETGGRITADTLRVFKSNLKIKELRESSYLSLCTEEPSRVAICSDTMNWESGSGWLHVRAYPNCTRAAVFGMSEQTVPFVLLVMSVLWGIWSLVSAHRNRNLSENGISGELTAGIAAGAAGIAAGSAGEAEACIPVESVAGTATGVAGETAAAAAGCVRLGSLSLAVAENRFFRNGKAGDVEAGVGEAGDGGAAVPVQFTPMQFQLMKLLFVQPGHCLPVEQICAALWPGKEDARETLYALVLRLKRVLADGSDLEIRAEKGGFYKLSVRR